MRAIGIPSLTELALIGVSNQVSKARAKKATAGTYMAGHMRWPWVRTVVWTPVSTGRKQRGEVRLIGSHRTAFGDQEAVGITLRLANANDVVGFVTAVVDRVLADRFHHEKTTDKERNLLQNSALDGGGARSREASEPHSCRQLCSDKWVRLPWLGVGAVGRSIGVEVFEWSRHRLGTGNQSLPPESGGTVTNRSDADRRTPRIVRRLMNGAAG